MGDVQSGEWTLESVRAHQECADAIDVQAAEQALEDAKQRFWEAENALDEARYAMRRAEGRLHVARLKPRRHQVLNPSTDIHGSQLYTYCMQLGYQFAVQNGRVCYAGQPGEGLIDTGLTLEDLPA